jgi:DNA-binding CsgD family transcriptional regulator
MADEPRKPRLRKRRIIERPRLIRALDRSPARVKLVIAGSGYGKTTLLEQWAPRDGRQVGWFRAASSPDVAVVARALATTCSQFFPGVDRRLLERLAATEDPEREAVLLAEMLSEDVCEWPRAAWIVIDDYHYLAASGASEAFVRTLVESSPLQVLIASRARPSWVKPRSILDGSVLEIPERALAMTADEVEEVLDGGPIELAPGLVALAGGWAAVVGLAGMVTTTKELDADQPDALYQHFADALYEGLEPTVRAGLTCLAALPLVNFELAQTILGSECAKVVCGQAISLGILDERDGRLELHPLLRTFFHRRAHPEMRAGGFGPFLDAWAYYQDRHELDAAFELAETLGEPGDIERLIIESMDELLNGARLSTLELWVERAAARIGETPAVLIAQAEVALRQGRHLTAQVVAERIIRLAPVAQEVAYRAYLVGGKAAHVGAREHDALNLFRSAEAASRTDDERRRARWGLLTATAALEMEAAYDLMSDLQDSTAEGLDPVEAVRVADKRLALGLRFGAIDCLAAAKAAAELLASVPDPFVRMSFRSTFSCALNLAAEYDAALGVATEMAEDAMMFRVDFALPYASLMRGAALAGLRRFDEAHESLDDALRQGVRCADTFAQQGVYAGRVRAFLHAGRVSQACALEPPDLTNALPGMRGEVWASRGLALACIGRVDEARRLADKSVDSTRAVESRALVSCINAMVALKTRDASLPDSLRTLIHVAFEAGAVDYVVTSYRASPDLVAALLRNPVTAERTGYVLARASDQEVARSVGMDALDAIDPVFSLSTREREVYDLLCEGLDNSEIAKHLFISHSTVKVHVHHVFDKLGIRSRTAVALNAANRRTQAAPATDDTSTKSMPDG